MLKKLLLVLYLITTLFGFSQNTVGTISITEDVFEAYTLFSVYNKSYLINNCGEVINQWNSNYPPGNAVYLLPNGNLLRAGRLDQSITDIVIGGRGGIIELYDWDDNLLWSYTYSGIGFSHHHDIYPLPNGNILMLAITIMSESEAIQAGRNPALLDDGELYNEQILELEPVGTNQANIVWEWNIKDHLIQDFDITKDNFGIVEDHPQRLDVNFLNGNSPRNNWLHVNSIQYDETRDQIILSSRLLSELWIIDHSTTTAEAASSSGGVYGNGGDFLYRWGNPEAYRQGTNIDRKLFGQHTPYFIPPGLPNENKILLFNNGINRSPSFSQVDIISPPETSLGVYNYVSGTSYLPTNTDFTYTDFSSNPSEFFSGIVSNAQQLPNGNILVCEGAESYFFELDANENKVWEYRNPVNNNNGTISNQFDPPPIGSPTFRAVKYPPNYPAFTGRDLTPGLSIEGNPNLAPCNNLSVPNFEDNTVSLYPNPTSNMVYIKTLRPIDKVEVYDIIGNIILITESREIDLSNYSEGIYFFKIYNSLGILSNKIIKN